MRPLSVGRLPKNKCSQSDVLGDANPKANRFRVESIRAASAFPVDGSIPYRTLLALTVFSSIATNAYPIDGEAILSAVYSERAKIETGIVEINVKSVVPDRGQSERTMTVTFDMISKSMQIDCDSPLGPQIILETNGSILLRRGRGAKLEGGVAERIASRDRLPSTFRMVNPLSLGLATSGEMLGKVGLDEVYDTYATGKIAPGDVSHGDKSVITVVGPGNRLARRLTVDISRDYLPIKLEVIRLSAGSDASEVVAETIDTSWERFHDLWVPVRSVSTRGGRGSTEVLCTWKTVNGPIPEGAFSEETLDLPSRAIVVDERLKTGPYIEKVIDPSNGRPDLELDWIDKNELKTEQKKVGWWLLVNAIVVAVLVALVIVRVCNARPRKGLS